MNPADWRPTLEGPLLRLRPGTADDADHLAQAAADPLIWAGHPATDRWRPEAFREYYNAKLPPGGVLIAIDRATGEIVGMSRYSSEATEPGEIEIGSTFLIRRCWGGAWNGELKRLMLDHAFRHVDRAIFLIGRDNLRSRSAMEKIGGRLTDRIHVAPIAGTPVEHLIYAIDRPGPG